MNTGTLFVVGTPLGNLDDLSPRAVRILGTVDLVAAEDTRRARSLLSRVPAPPPVVSFHAHSPPARLNRILRQLAEGAAVALVTDAGTPAISDPGAELVARAREAGTTVVAIPGPSAVTTALSISGMPADRYIFMGFIPRKGTERGALLERVGRSPWTVVLFESAARLVHLLEDLAASCGSERRAAVARELTKVHEELRAGTLAELAVYYQSSPPRGEVTVLVTGGSSSETASGSEPDRERALEEAAALLAAGQSRRDVAAQIAREFGIPRNEAYRMVMTL